MLINSLLKEELNKNANQALRYKIHLVNKENEDTEYSQQIVAPIVEKQMIGTQPIGAVPISSISFKIRGDASLQVKDITEFIMFYEVTILTELGEKIIKSRNYYIESMSYEKTSNTTSFTGLDLLSKLVTRYQEPEIEYPVAFYDWVVSFAELNHIEIENNQLFMGDYILEQSPNLDENYSNLDVLKRIAAFSLSFVYVNHQNKLRFIECTQLMNTAYEDTITHAVKSVEFSANKYKKHGVNTLVLALQEDIDGENFTIEDQTMIELDGVVELRLNDIPFVPNQDSKEWIANQMFEAIKGFRYESYRLESKFWFYELGDRIDLRLANESSVILSVFSVEINHQGSAMTVIGAESEDLADTLTKWSEISPRKRTEIKVDKINSQINIVVEKQETLNDLVEEQSAQWSIATDSIRSDISEITLKQEGDQQILQHLTSEVNQLADSFTISFTRINESVEQMEGSLSDLKTYYRFDENGVLIGKDESPMSISISNDQMGFLQSGSVVAYINGQKMFITQAEITQTFIVGYHQIEKYDGTEKGTLIKLKTG